MTALEALNPFSAPTVATGDTTAGRSEHERAIREVEAAMVVAKRFPRDRRAAMDRILQACTRVTLAEHALYAYPRGGSVVTGPSIRLAEALAQEWGNLQFGIRELSQGRGESTVEAFAWDIEHNTRQVKTFQVPHIRYTKEKGRTPILDGDPRDIYELVANQGARRLRACILGIIPGDVVDAAVRQCELTMEHATGAPAEEVERMASAFEPLGVTREMLAKRLGHHLDATIAAEIISLRKIFASLRDGMAKVADFFPVDAGAENGSGQAADINERLKARKRPQKAAKAQEDAEAAPEEKAALATAERAVEAHALSVEELLERMRTAESPDDVLPIQLALGDTGRFAVGSVDRNTLLAGFSDMQRRLGI